LWSNEATLPVSLVTQYVAPSMVTRPASTLHVAVAPPGKETGTSRHACEGCPSVNTCSDVKPPLTSAQHGRCRTVYRPVMGWNPKLYLSQLQYPLDGQRREA
jgi:hypothetical protein